MPPVRPLLFGHRGARPISRYGLKDKAARVPPENTIPSFEYALAQGVDGFEFDVRLTGDQRLVICHDAWVGSRNVSASSLRSLCSSGSLFCCLEDVLEAFAKRAYLDIEVKIAGIEEAVAAAVCRHRPQRGFLISSFFPEVLLRLHEVDSSLPLGYVCQRAASLSLWRKLPVVAVLPSYKLITQNLVRDIHGEGIQVFTWTVNQRSSLVQLAGWEIDGIISDDPGLLARTFRAEKLSQAKPGSGSGERAS